MQIHKTNIVVDIIEPQDTTTAMEPETAEAYDTPPLPPDDPVEATGEPNPPPPITLVESADSTPVDDPITPKPKKAPRKKKEKGEAVAPENPPHPRSSKRNRRPRRRSTQRMRSRFQHPQRLRRSPGPNLRPKRFQHNNKAFQHTTTRVRGLDPRRL